MEHPIICSNQIRIHKLVVNNIPSIIEHKSKQNIEFPNEDFSFNLLFKEPVPYLNIRYTTDDDLQTLPHLNIASTNPWNPEYLTTFDRVVTTLNIHYTQDNLCWLINILNEQVHISSIKHYQSKALSHEYLSTLC